MLERDGRAILTNNPFVPTVTSTPAPSPSGVASAARARPRAQVADRNVRAELARLRRIHAISTAAYRSYLASFNLALRTVRRLHGTRAFEPASEADRGFRPVTIGGRVAAIAAAHRAQDHPNPCDSGAVAAVMSGIRREHGTRPLRRAAPLELDPLARLFEPIDTATLAGRRDRALLLLPFAAALRRSELVALDAEDLSFDAACGLKIMIRKSKRDQERGGATVAVPYARAGNRCAVRALQAWLHAAGIHRGPVFRQMRRGDTLTDRRLSDQSVALIVKRRAQAAGLPTALLSGHSLRAGYATAAAAAGVEERRIANVTRHKNLAVLRGYIRAATAFDDVGEIL